GVTVLNLVGADVVGWLRSGGVPSRGLIAAITWTTLVMVFAATMALRVSLRLPIEQRANWIFRMAETDASRRWQLNAVEGAFIRLAIGFPLLVMFPLHWLAFGARAFLTTGLTALCGLVLVEAVLNE